MTVRVTEGPGFLESLADEWNDLLSDSPTATPFSTQEWMATWWRYFGRNRKAVLFEVREGTDLVGLFPTFVTSGPWRTLRAMGTGPSDYLHPLARSGQEQAVAKALEPALRDLLSVDLLDLHGMREDQPIVSMTTDDQARCLVLDLPPTYDAFLASLGKSLRYDVRRLDKSPFKEGDATIESYPPGNIGEGMDVLLELHRARWRAKRLPGAFVGRLVPFQRAWIAEAAKRDWLWLSVLRLKGEPIGALYAMTVGKQVFYYQAGFAPTEGSISPGTLLVAHTIRRAIEEGKTRFDFLRGDEDYKRRWKPQHAFMDRRAVIPLTARGRAGAGWIAQAWKVEAKVRGRLEG
ncbi:GNAT family N-acetyltransferase [bacterium]|nr:MAG: GNAT family N-acetyltransferase [bacterium]